MVGFLFYVLLLERKIVMMINVPHLKKECNLTQTGTFLSLKYPFFFFFELGNLPCGKKNNYILNKMQHLAENFCEKLREMKW